MEVFYERIKKDYSRRIVKYTTDNKNINEIIVTEDKIEIKINNI